MYAYDVICALLIFIESRSLGVALFIFFSVVKRVHFFFSSSKKQSERKDFFVNKIKIQFYRQTIGEKKKRKTRKEKIIKNKKKNRDTFNIIYTLFI
jgi:hypothetical protein